MSELYRSMFVWKRLSGEGCIRFGCFENLGSGKFYVQSADFFRVPIQKEVFRNHAHQQVELFVELDISERCEGYSSLTKAIEAHERDFE